jgi:hypothetical protein
MLFGHNLRLRLAEITLIGSGNGTSYSIEIASDKSDESSRKTRSPKYGSQNEVIRTIAILQGLNGRVYTNNTTTIVPTPKVQDQPV